MKPVVLFSTAALAAGAGLALLLLHRHAALAADAPAPPVATVTLVAPQRARVDTTIVAYGDVAPGKVQSVSFPRPGLLALLPVVVGQRVRQGAVVGRLTSDPAAEAAYRQARSALTLAEGEVQRTQSLFALQLATASQVETARKAAADARANVDAQEKLGGGLVSAEATAPFDGVVLALVAAQGDRLAAGAPILQVGRVDRLKVNLGLEPAERRLVQVGAPALLQPLQSVSGDATTPVAQGAPGAAGSVASVQDLVDPKTQLVNAVVEVGTGDAAALVPGMRVSARVRTGQQDGWVVPRSAVLSDDKGAYLFQAAGGKAHRVAVTALSEQGDQLSVSGPLAGDAPVVSVGNYELSEGMQLKGVGR